MSDPVTIWAFVAAVVAIVIVPGADMAIITASAMNGGRSAGFAAVGGVALGASAHILFSILGLSALVAANPAILYALGFVGAGYLLWLGLAFLRASDAPTPIAAHGIGEGGAAWRRAMTTNLLNPKAYLFMLVVFPQFIRRDGWPVWLQALTLGAILLAIAVTIYGGIALAAAQAGRRLMDRPDIRLWINRGAGGALLLLGIALAAAQIAELRQGG